MSMEGKELMDFAAQRAHNWTQALYDEATQSEVRTLLEEGGEDRKSVV